jgi:biotin transport system substrate-specific component
MHPSTLSTSSTASSRTASFAGFASTLPGQLLIGLAATLLVAAAAHVAIPLPFTPVPLTLQPLAVLGVGLALGPVAGFLTMLAYLAEGACGLPVFSPTGLGGLAQLLGPTGGFLLAYPLVAAIAGGCTRLFSARIPRFAAQRFFAAAVGCTLAIALLFVSGAAWLMQLAHLSTHAVWIVAVAPFLPGEAIKILIAAGVYNALAPAFRSPKSGPPTSIA